MANLHHKGEVDNIELTMITNHGTRFTGGYPETFLTDHWRCRFTYTGDDILSNGDRVRLLGRLDEAGNYVIKTENFYHYDGKPDSYRDKGSRPDFYRETQVLLSVMQGTK